MRLHSDVLGVDDLLVSAQHINGKGNDLDLASRVRRCCRRAFGRRGLPKSCLIGRSQRSVRRRALRIQCSVQRYGSRSGRSASDCAISSCGSSTHEMNRSSTSLSLTKHGP
jgi:hypothetical protein